MIEPRHFHLLFLQIHERDLYVAYVVTYVSRLIVNICDWIMLQLRWIIQEEVSTKPVPRGDKNFCSAGIEGGTDDFVTILKRGYKIDQGWILKGVQYSC